MAAGAALVTTGTRLPGRWWAPLPCSVAHGGWRGGWISVDRCPAQLQDRQRRQQGQRLLTQAANLYQRQPRPPWEVRNYSQTCLCFVSRRPRVAVIPCQAHRSGATLFGAPQPSDETMIAEVGPSDAPELYCHRHQTDQLMVLRGSLDLIVLQEGRLRRISLRDDAATWVRIPPGVPHGAINRGQRPAVVVNAVLRHGPSDPRDYRARPVPSFLASAWAALAAGSVG